MGDLVQISYKWTRNEVVLISNERVQYLMNGINFTDGQGGMNCGDSGIYKLMISNIAGSAVTYLMLDVQSELVSSRSFVQTQFLDQLTINPLSHT